MEKENNIPGSGNKFGVPEGYFDSFNERLFAKLEGEEELKEFPKLSAMAKEFPFAAPDNYFGSLEQKINARIEKEGHRAKVISLGSFIKKYKYAIAAVFVLAIGTPLFFKLQKQSENLKTDTACLELACLTKEDITSSQDFYQISLSDLEAMAGQEIQDSLGAEINKDVIDELMQHPEELTDDDLEL